jgi:predicted esterase
VNPLSLRTELLEVTKTARVFAMGPAPEETDRILVALHGYAQHPAYFLKRLEPLAAEGWAILAPEGLHRFYIQGTSGRVGASWMTSEDRENDIKDYVRYLESMRAQLMPPSPRFPHGQHRVLLGFSQGVPTAARWAAAHPGGWDQLIFWAGIFPPDLEQWAPPPQATWSRIPIDWALGDQDPFFQDAHYVPAETWFDQHQIPYRTHRFEGGHHLDFPLLERLLREGSQSDT